MPADEDFDLIAAGIRSDGSDLRISLEALAAKLETALPEQTRVERSGGGMFARGPKRVRKLAVHVGDARYLLSTSGQGMEGTRTREVGGIAIKHEVLDPGAWVAALTEDLRAQAQQSAQTRSALERLLG
ncbi:MAG TPA: hypothetical protein VFW38_05840 [Solirubrobacteraceae bacterium]|nr:hypothetical protein [Solirubrobacteraceae bacterium]